MSIYEYEVADYKFDNEKDFQILGMCTALKMDHTLTGGESELVALIENQLSPSWRDFLIERLERIVRKRVDLK